MFEKARSKKFEGENVDKPVSAGILEGPSSNNLRYIWI